MLESVVVSVLNQVLSDYIDNLGSQQIDLQIWNGDLTMKDLRLRKEALDKLEMNLEIVKGHLGELSLKIPWNDLKNKPVVIKIKQLFILAEPKSLADVDIEQIIRDEFVKKLARLNAHELLVVQNSGKAGASQQQQQQDNSFFSQLVTKIVDNLQFNIENIHMRIQFPGDGFSSAFGVTLKQLSIVSTNSEWQEFYIQSTQPIVYKLAALDQLSVYHTTVCKTVNPDDFLAFISSWNDKEEEYLIQPIKGTAQITLRKKEFPRVEAHVSFDDLSFLASKKQYSVFLSQLESLQMTKKIIRNFAFRPPATIRPTLDPKAWFQYAVKVTLKAIHEKRKQWTWENIKKRRDDRVLYIRLWRSKLEGREEKANVREDLERNYEVEDIIFWRSLAREQHEKEKKQATTPVVTSSSGWFGGFFGGSSGAQQQATVVDSKQLQEEISKRIDYNPTAIVSSYDDATKNTVIHLIKVFFKSGIFNIRNKNEFGAGFSGLSLVYSGYKDSMSIEARIADVEAKYASQKMIKKRQNIRKENVQEKEEDFLYLCYENARRANVDHSLVLKVLPVECIVQESNLIDIIKFFSIDTPDDDWYGDYLKYAMEGVKSLSSQTRTGITYAIEKHKVMDIQVDVGTPIFIFPGIRTVLLNAGHLTVRSKLADKSLIPENAPLNEENVRELVYDRFVLCLHETQVVVAPNIAGALGALSGPSDGGSDVTQGSGSFHVLENVNLEFCVEKCILDTELFTGLVVRGSVDRLCLNVSEKKWDSIMAVLGSLANVMGSIGRATSPSVQSIPEAIGEDESVDFYDAVEDVDNLPDSPGDTSIATVTQKQEKSSFEFFFKVSELKLNLQQSKMDEALIAFMKIDSFNLEYSMGTQDFCAVMFVHSAEIHDKLYSGEKLFWTRNPQTSVDEHFITVKYSKLADRSIADVEFADIEVAMIRSSLLQLYEFIIDTFGNQSGGTTHANDDTLSQAISLNTNNEASHKGEHPFHVNARMKCATIHFDTEKGHRIATLAFHAGSLGLSLETGRVSVKGGMKGVTLLNELDALQTKLVSNHGDTILDFDMVSKARSLSRTVRVFDTHLELSTGSIRLNLVEDPWIQLFGYFNEFQKMQAVIEAARNAAYESAALIQEATGLFSYNLDISTPVLEFPKDGTTLSNVDAMHAFLGHFSIQKTEDTGFNLAIGVSNMNILSLENDVADKIVQDINLKMLIEDLSSSKSNLVPPTFMKGSLTDIHLQMTHMQYVYLNEMLVRISRLNAAYFGSAPATPETVHQSPEPPNTTSELYLEIPKISFELLSANQDGGMNSSSFSKFNVFRTEIRLAMFDNGDLRAEIVAMSYELEDTRLKGNSVFKRLLDPVESPIPTLCFRMRRDALGNSDYHVMLERPTIIVLFDQITDISNFFLLPQYPIPEDQQVYQATMSFELKIRDFNLSLLQDTSLVESGAAVFKMTTFYFVYNDKGMVLQAKNIGSFFCNMDRKDLSETKFVEDFDVNFELIRTQNSGISYEISLTPIKIRISYREAFLLMNILENWNKGLAPGDVGGQSPGSSPVSPSSDSLSSARHQPQPQVKVESIGQHMNIRTQGLRIMLIDDLNDLHIPMFDINFDKTVVDIRDWNAFDVGIDMLFNYYNIRNSHWEPAIERWHVTFRIKYGPPFEAEVFSANKLEVNLSTALIETILDTQVRVAAHNQKTLGLLTRNIHDPYIIRNRTGYRMHLWTVSNDDGLDTQIHTIEDGDQINWRYVDWKTMREGASNITHSVAIQLDGSSWESIKGVSLDMEGVEVYLLRPKINHITHRLLCDISMKGNIKYVTLRSAFVLANRTSIDLEINVANANGEPLLESSIILQPQEEYSIPIEFVFDGHVRIRPHGFRYNWSTQAMHWRALQSKESVHPIRCRSLDSESVPFTYFANASYPPYALKRISSYPNLRVDIHPPFQIENLLPFEIRFWLKDKTTNYEQRDTIPMGGSRQIHTVAPTDYLAAAIDIPECSIFLLLMQLDFRASQLAILSNAELDYRDEHIELIGPDDRIISVAFMYSDVNGGLVVSVYSPYIILNKTGMDMSLLPVNSKKPQKVPFTGISLEDKSFAAFSKIEPFLFGYVSHSLKNRCQIRIGDSDYSKPLSFEAVGSATEVSIPSHSRGVEYQVGIDIKEAQGQYRLTKIVTITPRYIITNQTAHDIECRRKGTSSSFVVAANTTAPLMYLLPSEDAHQLCLRLTGLMNEWSSNFKINQIGKIHLKLTMIGSSEEQLLRVEIALKDAVIYISVMMETGPWPFRIDNQTDLDVVIYQQRSRKKFIVFKQKSKVYAWDNPTEVSKALILQVNGKERELDLLEIGHMAPLKYPLDNQTGKYSLMDIYTYADGPTIVVKLSAYRPKSGKKVMLDTSEEDSDMAAALLSVSTDSVLSTFKLRFDGFGLSLINKKMKEIAYITVKGLCVLYRDSRKSAHYEITTKWIQVDNQMHNTIAPILMYPTMIPKDAEDTNRPVFLGRLIRSKDRSYGVEYYHLFTLLLQELSVDLDDDILMALSDFATFHVPGWDNTSLANADASQIYDTSMTFVSPRLDEGTMKMYFETFLLHPLLINLSYSRTGTSAGDGFDDRIKRKQNVVSVVTDVLTMTVGNIHEAPIRANALELYHPIMTFQQLADLMFKFYSQEMIGQLHKIIGSADFLGNPVGLFNNFTAGVSDLFYEPIQGFEITRPQDFGINIAKGTASLLKRTVYGVSDTFSKFTGSVGKGLSVITMDDKFQEQRRISRIRNRPKHAVTGVTQGATSLAKSLVSGISGVVSKPIEGAEKEGFGGFFKGLGKGIVGVVTKPVVGVFDLASNVSEGIKNTTTVFENDLDRQRLPRHTGRDRVLKPYNYREALGLNWLKSVDNGKYANEEYVNHLELKIEDITVLITDCRILILKMKKLKSLYDISFSELQRIVLKEREVMLITKASNEEIQPFSILFPDVSSARWIHGKIEAAFMQHWSTHRALE